MYLQAFQPIVHQGRTGRALGDRDSAVNHYKKSEQKWKKYLKALKKQNKILYSISKKSGLRRELKDIKISRPRLPRSAATLAATLPAVTWFLIPLYPVIVTEMKRGILMNVRR